jgi:hypothetical protein
MVKYGSETKEQERERARERKIYDSLWGEGGGNSEVILAILKGENSKN